MKKKNFLPSLWYNPFSYKYLLCSFPLVFMVFNPYSYAYQLAQQSVQFGNAFLKLGFKDRQIEEQLITVKQQEEAILRIFYMAGYLTPERLWQDVNHVQSITNKREAFFELTHAIKHASANQKNYAKFQPDLLYQYFTMIPLDSKQWMDLLLYISQHAFNRDKGQERNELIKQNWMEVFHHEYIKEATLLGLINRKLPEFKKYDMVWVTGASRPGLLARLEDYQYLLEQMGITIKNGTLILAGGRELWANIDGMSYKLKNIFDTTKSLNIDNIDVLVTAGDKEEAVQEGAKYIQYLAEQTGIKLNESQPLIQYKTKEDCPAGRLPGRLYPNYADEEERKLTETTMAQDLFKKYIDLDTSFEIIDTDLLESQRPTTATTVRETVEFLVKQILQGTYGAQKEFIILFQTNNPYIERMTIAAQREANEVFKKYHLQEQGYSIKIDGVGFACKQDVVTVHSELAALMAEKWKQAFQDEENAAEYIKTLLFQTRDNNFIDEPMPVEITGNQLNLNEVD
ncbi:hypothetical protein [Candidatus Trichorickettsia mobilis]|uniref:hypothetical protein n=1 Tax=Candidatus Trichorickettsia mobilis TaxID=1346319 RepID=UPI002930B994|nr:hypothetical protein [Candidatus Trichorickettsia mobilis]